MPIHEVKITQKYVLFRRVYFTKRIVINDSIISHLNCTYSALERAINTRIRNNF
jgi:hypothetical protein